MLHTTSTAWQPALPDGQSSSILLQNQALYSCDIPRNPLPNPDNITSLPNILVLVFLWREIGKNTFCMRQYYLTVGGIGAGERNKGRGKKERKYSGEKGNKRQGK